jgi:hypothetical protein
VLIDCSPRSGSVGSQASDGADDIGEHVAAAGEALHGPPPLDQSNGVFGGDAL